MLKNRHAYSCIVALAFSLIFAVTPVMAASHSQGSSLVGPKKNYLALGDSLAFGYQPNFDFKHGYVEDFFANLQGHGVKTVANTGCPGETSTTFINGTCPFPLLRKYPYTGSQLNAAVKFLTTNAGKVSPVTLDIGANDVSPDIDVKTCTVSSNFDTDLATLDSNLTQTILPQLHQALLVKGKVTGDLVMMNYYDPYQNICPNTVPYLQTLNQHLATDVSKYGIIVDVFTAFGDAGVPNANICTYTWICSSYKDIHPMNKGYSVIATTFEQGTGY